MNIFDIGVNNEYYLNKIKTTYAFILLILLLCVGVLLIYKDYYGWGITIVLSELITAITYFLYNRKINQKVN